jgi:outer membrane murein-binding lipoprotein Lpp
VLRKRLEQRVNFVAGLAEHLINRQEKLMATIDDLKSVVDALVGKVDALLNAFAAAATDPAKIQALVDEGKAEIAKVDAVLNPPPPSP